MMQPLLLQRCDRLFAKVADIFIPAGGSAREMPFSIKNEAYEWPLTLKW